MSGLSLPVLPVVAAAIHHLVKCFQASARAAATMIASRA